MNEAAPFAWLLAQIESMLTATVSGGATAIANEITPLVTACFGIYVILITLNYLRGAETEPVLDFGLRIAGFAVVIGLGLNAPNYVSTVIPIVTGLGGDLAGAITGSATVDAVDKLMIHYVNVIYGGFEDAGHTGLLDGFGAYCILAIKVVCLICGLAPLLIAAALALLTAKVGSLLVAMVGPIFFAFLLFPATRQYFSAWVNTAFSYALIPLFVAAVASVAISLATTMMGGATLEETKLQTIMMASACNLLLVFVIRQVSSLASSLSAGGINAAVSNASIGGAARSIASQKGAAQIAQATAKGAAYGAKAIYNKVNGNAIRKAG